MADINILAISDEVEPTIYNNRLKTKFPQVDLILGCGDLPFYYLDFVASMLDKPVYFVPGNHDQLPTNRGRAEMGDDAWHYMEGAALDGKVVAVSIQSQTVLLAGLGGCLRYRPSGAHQYTQRQMFLRVVQLTPALVVNRLRYGRYLDLLITHAPPRGIHDRPSPAHTGLDAFVWLMQVFKPRFLLHGHTHLYRRNVPTLTPYRQTDVVNVYPYHFLKWSPQ